MWPLILGLLGLGGAAYILDPSPWTIIKLVTIGISGVAGFVFLVNLWVTPALISGLIFIGTIMLWACGVI